MLQEKKDYDDNIQNIFHLISFKKHNPIVLGSARLANLLYPNDYDLFEIVRINKNKKHIIEDIHRMFYIICMNIKKNKNLYFIEFKAGIYEPLYITDNEILDKKFREAFYKKKLREGIINEKIYNEIKKTNDLVEYCSNLYKVRWTIDELMAGYKHLFNGTEYLFEDIFKHKSIIKIDVMNYHKNLFTSFSNMFEFMYTSGEKINRDYTNNVIKNLYNDMHKYTSKGNYYKALKRYFSIAQLEKRPANELLVFVEFFNSPIGKLYQSKSLLSNCLEVLALYNDAETNRRINRSIKEIYTNISDENKKEYKELFKKTIEDKDNLYYSLEELINTINKNIQESIKKSTLISYVLN